MKNMKFAVLLALGLTLSACAPAVLGNQVFAPVVVDSALSPVAAKAGQTLYVQYSYNRGVLDVADARFENLKISFDERTTNGDVRSQETPAPWLNMTARGLPKTWEISLAAAAVRKEVLKTTYSSTSTDIRYVERIRVVYKILVPADASGHEMAMLTFRDGTAEVGDVPLMINVGNFSGPTVGAQF